MENLQRYFIEFAYDGTHFHGWQSQPNAVTVQQVLEEKLEIVLREKVVLVGAGRTDTGVHASQMFAHFDFSSSIYVEDLRFKLNNMLPLSVAVKAIRRVKPDAHARFDALSRTYYYHLHFRKDPFRENFSTRYTKPLNWNAIKAASTSLIEFTDFAAFCKSNAGSKTTICKIAMADWEIEGNYAIFTIKADRFLRNMVRAIVGTLILVGEEKISVEDFKKIVEIKDRRAAGPSAPPQGLFLAAVEYPDDIFIDG